MSAPRESDAESNNAAEWEAPPADLGHHAAQDYQSLMMHVEAVKLLQQNPALVDQALTTLARWRQTADARSFPLLDEWQDILMSRAWTRAVARDERGNQLRQASPLGTVLPQETRLAIIAHVRALKQAAQSSSAKTAPGDAAAAQPIAPATGGFEDAMARGRDVKREWTRDGTLVTPEVFAQARGVSVQDLRDVEAAGTLFSMVVDDASYYLAELLKFAPADAAAVCLALGGEEPASKVIFFMRKHGMLGGKTVAQAVEGGRLDAVLSAAEAWRERR